MSLSSVLTKIDSLSVDDQIKELSGLASGLLEMQHRRYPHLVPMYRTVHRTVPRRMVFRAIRWVNPKRMFPGAGLTKEEMQKMSAEELTELAVTLNKYREEAHVIHNRYNQMIWLIERGQSPYFIPYANIKEPRWLLLEGYLGRANRLKDGTMDWERVLDQQAQDLRSVLLQEDKGKVKFDDIEGLWVDPNGQPRAPMFMDVKQKKGVPLRKQRTINGERLKVQPQAFARLFIGVAPDEVRQGEEVRMPHEGNYVNPDWIGNREKRILARDMGEAAMHLARIPKAPIRIAQIKRQQFAEQGQLLTIPAGRDKNPVFIVFDNVPADKVANRRWQRVTQPERGGRHARGAPFSGPGGVHRPPAPGVVQAFPQVQPAPAQPPPVAPQPPPQPAAPSAPARTSAIRRAEADVRNKQNGLGDVRLLDAIHRQNDNRDNLLQEWNQPLNIFGSGPDPVQQNPETAGFTNGDLTGQRIPAGHGHGVRNKVNFTLQVGGKPYIYKVHHEDSRGELFAFMMDRAAGLGAMPAIHTHQYGRDAMKSAFDSVHGAGALGNQYGVAAGQAAAGGGHLMEFCQNCMPPLQSGSVMKEMMKTKEGRNEFNKLTFIDFVTGNGDRHQGNWLIHQDGKMVAIDNSYSIWDAYGDPDVRRDMTLGRAGRLIAGVPVEDWKGVTDVSGAKITKETIRDEAGEFFDEHFDVNKLKAGADAVNVRFKNSFTPEHNQALRDSFVSHCVSNFSQQLSNIGP